MVEIEWPKHLAHIKYYEPNINTNFIDTGLYVWQVIALTLFYIKDNLERTFCKKDILQPENIATPASRNEQTYFEIGGRWNWKKSSCLCLLVYQ